MAFLACVAGIGDGFLPYAVAVGQKLVELLELTVAQRIHRVNDNRADARAGVTLAPASQDIMHDRNKIGEGFAGTGPSRQHITVALLGDADRLLLMLVQTHGLPKVLRRLVGPKNCAALFMQ